MKLSVAHVQQTTLPILGAVPRPIVMWCPHKGCRFPVSALSQGRVERAIAAHIIKAHWRREKEQA